jgi:NAD-dependent DNA ligase
MFEKDKIAYGEKKYVLIDSSKTVSREIVKFEKKGQHVSKSVSNKTSYMILSYINTQILLLKQNDWLLY